jgi:chorismate mutase
MTLDEMITVWTQAKESERQATELRRNIEDEIKAALSVPDDLEGTFTAGPVKITGRIDRKVDADKLQELAAEAGLTEHIRSLFRWKPEINQAAWKAADESITRPLLGAITSKPGRPSFALHTKKES